MFIMKVAKKESLVIFKDSKYTIRGVKKTVGKKYENSYFSLDIAV